MSAQTFLSCDWGTSHLRIRLVETATLTVLAELKTEEGVARISQAGPAAERSARFAQTLLHRTQQLFQQAGVTSGVCIVSGMASSSMGWLELPYVSAPLRLSADGLLTHAFSLPGLTAVLVSGVRTTDDVMRGEECEVLGLMGLEPDLAAAPACLILPGTHSKHIRLEGQVLAGFTTHMTGEIYAQLRQTPTLHAALSVNGETSEEEFLAGVAAAQKDGLLAALFKIRARSLIPSRMDLHGPSFLSGALIGSELLGLPTERPVFLGCAAPLSGFYTLAAAALKIPLCIIPPETLPLALLHAHHDLLPR